MEIKFTQEKRGEIERIQREFRDKLSANEILRGTARGINSALTRSIPRINKHIKGEYNIAQKYLSRQVLASPKASSVSLWGGLKINQKKIPIIAFKPKQSGSAISVSIRKGQTKLIRNAFIATMDSGHIGTFARGKYNGSEFQPGQFKPLRNKTKGHRITELLTVSPFTMSITKEVSSEVQEFMGNEVTRAVHGILTGRVAKITGRGK